LPDTTHPALVRRQGFRSTYGLLEPSDTKTVMSSSNGAVSAGFHILQQFLFCTAAMAIHPYNAFRQRSLHGNLSSPLSFPRADHRGAVRVLHLEPVPRRARRVRRAEPLRHNALEAHDAGLADDRGAVLVVLSTCGASARPAASLAASCGRPAGGPEGLRRRAPAGRSRRAWPR
jgi:hypothetical protein